MSNPMRIYLRAGEKIFVNGAVLRVDRRVAVDLLNEASFLLEGHVIQPEEATTPLRQLYFALQTMLMEPESETARPAYEQMLASARELFANSDVLTGLNFVAKQVGNERIFDALKTLRRLFPIEELILSGKAKMSLPAA